MAQQTPSLQEFLAQGVRQFSFVSEYIGVRGPDDPAQSPHRFSWRDAEEHWQTMNHAMLHFKGIPADASRKQKVQTASLYAAQLLWIFAKARLCPSCDPQIVAGMAAAFENFELKGRL